MILEELYCIDCETQHVLIYFISYVPKDLEIISESCFEIIV